MEQGKFAELNVPGTYIHELQVELLEKDDLSHNQASGDIGPSDAGQQPLIDATKSEADESRKTGDWKTYKYYARALGPYYLFLFFILVAGNHTCSAMGSESRRDIMLQLTVADDTRYLAEQVGGGQPKWQQKSPGLLAWDVWLFVRHERYPHGWCSGVSS